MSTNDDNLRNVDEDVRPAGTPATPAAVEYAARLGRIKQLMTEAGLLDRAGEKESARALFDQARAAAINEARDILKGTERTPGELLNLAKLLEKQDEFNVGRRLLDRAREHDDFGKDKDERIKIIQKRALYTYKDVTQPLGKRLDEALEFLEKHGDLAGTTDQETLGLTGAIYKRKWELDKQESHLRRSRFYYTKGYQQKPWKDQGYTSINAAFILDLLAYLNRSNAEEAKKLRDEARHIRGEIVQDVPPMAEVIETKWLAGEWFYYSTVGEAHFGLGDFLRAHEWLVTKPEAAGVRPPDWEFETTARQLANLARVQSDAADFTETPAWAAFKKFLSESPMGKGGDVSAEAVRRLFDGKVGLALSGGGFRASLFHIGVLARLAELDVLRRVEVISCVSGGSIVGAHYYLELRKLLGEKSDSEITKEDYLAIVERLEKEFLLGVQANIRTKVLTDSRAVRQMLRRDYSRTMRLGELYEEDLYSRVEDEVGRAPGADGKVRERYMHDLVIRPRLGGKGGGAWNDFKPRNHNWRREAKAPILILNAATLNTGHNWQFTATYMGEAPATIHREVDSVYRLRRKYYTEAPHSITEPQRVRLGAAVAASSCVPILFEPVVLDDMYETPGGERLSVKLVDGGACDNQGVAGLLEQDCTVLLVSDGSGQIDAADRPSAEALSVGIRTNNIIQARVRGTQYRELDARLSASMLNGLMFVHLKKDLDNNPVNWKGCPPDSKIAPADDRRVQTRYGISKEVQRRLAAIRTDLDSFCDQEAYALMTSAYRMTEYEFNNQRRLSQLIAPGAQSVGWDFLGVEPLMKESDGVSPEFRRRQDDFTRLLDTGSGLFMKIWNLDEELKRRKSRLKKLLIAVALIVVLFVSVVLAALALSALAYFFFGAGGFFPPWVLAWVGALVVLSVFGFASLCVVALALYFLRLRGVPDLGGVLAHQTVGALLLVIGSPAARYHMKNFEKPYLDLGRFVKPTT